MNDESERFVMPCKPREGLTDADVQAYYAARKVDAKLIDPENCEIIKLCVDLANIYGLLDVEGGFYCIGNQLFVRNLPDGEWVWLGDLPEATRQALKKTKKEPQYDELPF